MTVDTGEVHEQPAIVEGIDFAVRPVTSSRVPVRVLGSALLVLALLAAAPALLGAHSRTVPPFGPARNGLIAWAIDGDIDVGDPVTGTTRVLMKGPDLDRDPVFSRDGSRIAFLRQLPGDPGRFDLMVADAEGEAPVLVSAVPIPSPDAIEWAPDGASILVSDRDGQLTRYYVDGSPARAILDGVHLEPDAFRPPLGLQLLYERHEERGAIYVMDVAGSEARPLVGPMIRPCECTVAGSARWSPDGQRVAFPIRVNGDESRLFVMDADGTDLRPLTDETGPWRESDPAWSPVGDLIAFDRWQRDDAGDWQVRAIAIVPSVGGEVRSVGVAPASEGALIEWAPDGRAILSLPRRLADGSISYPGTAGAVARPVVIDVADGSSRQIPWSVGSAASWQRSAP
jgi:Tol biopolymer transport system component